MLVITFTCPPYNACAVLGFVEIKFKVYNVCNVSPYLIMLIWREKGSPCSLQLLCLWQYGGKSQLMICNIVSYSSVEYLCNMEEKK